jgi:hypothetical protein
MSLGATIGWTLAVITVGLVGYALIAGGLLFALDLSEDSAVSALEDVAFVVAAPIVVVVAVIRSRRRTAGR